MTARFCDQCAASLVALSVPHVQRPCQHCGKTVHIAEPGEGGKGIKVSKGDKFVIPSGWLKISLNPRHGRLARPGLSWFVRMMIFGDLPREPDAVPDLLNKWESEAEKILRSSIKLEHLDLDNEQDAEKALQILKGDPSVEWWAMAVALFVAATKERLQSGATADATLFALRSAAAWSMLVFVRDLEEYVWVGYEHAQLIYSIASAAAQTPADAKAIEALQPIFENLREEVLHAWVESGVDIGPRIGVATVDEQLLKALAKYHLGMFERRRAERERQREGRSRTIGHLIAGAAAGAALATAVLGILSTTGVI